MKNRSSLVALNCLAIGSGFYLTQIIPVSPIYPLALAAILLIAFSGAQRRLTALPPHLTVNIVIGLATLHFVLYLVWISPFNSALGFYLNFFFLALAWKVLPYVDRAQMDRIGLRLLDVTIAIGAAEALVRWVFPFQQFNEGFLDYVDESGSTFYLYKFNSIMYQDSNFVGMWLLVIVAFAIEHYGWRRTPGRIAALTALLCLTICRSALIFFIVYLLLKYLRKKVPNVALRTLIIGVTATAGLAAFASVIVNDESFRSKLTIFGLASANYLAEMTPERAIFGVGIAKSFELLDGIAAHNFLLELLMETGIFGLLYVLTGLFALARMGGPAGRTIVWLFIGAGLSFAPMTTPYMYVVLSILAVMRSGRVPRQKRRAPRAPAPAAVPASPVPQLPVAAQSTG